MRRGGRLIVALLILGLYGFLALDGTPKTPSLDPTTRAYAYLAEGFLRGELSLSLRPDPHLLDLADPYDPATNVNLRAHDLLLYQGRYYLQHGPLPVLLWLPWKALFGAWPSAAAGIAVFMGLAFLALFGLLLELKDQFFSERSEAWVLAGGLGIGVGNGAVYLLSRPSFYEACVASSAGLLGAACFACWREIRSGLKVGPWLVAAALLGALACWGRPNMIFGVSGLALAMAFAYRDKPSREKALAWLLGSVAVAGLGWAAYNFARFGNPLELGTRYQLGGYRIEGSGYYAFKAIPSNLLANLREHFFGGFEIHRSFPFLRERPPQGFVPGSSYHSVGMVGLLAFWPMAWLPLALPFLKHPGAAGARLKLALSVVAVAVLGILGFLMILGISTLRYQMDYAGPLLFLAAACSLWLASRLKGLARAALILALSLNLAWGLAAGLCFAAWGHQGDQAMRHAAFFQGLNQRFSLPLDPFLAAHAAR